jgi:hypothetical protein
MNRLPGVMLGLFLGAATLWAVQTGMVAGFVRESQTGEFLSYANVYLADGSQGTATNRQGYYVLSGVPAGRHTLLISMIGFTEERVDIEVKPAQRLRRDFYLKPQPLGMAEVEVTAERARFEHEVDIGVQHIDINKFRNIPTLGGEDLFRSLEMLPGVISVSDFTSALYIRGGTADQNLVLLDGMPIYNPYHLLGAFSTFVIEPLKDAELYTGGFPARYGGAASSVLDVRMRDGSRDEVKASGELGLLSSKLTVEGPLPWVEGSWIVAGRRTYLDAATWMIDQIFKPESLSLYYLLPEDLQYLDLDRSSFYLPYHFYDLQMRVNIGVGERSSLTLSGFLSEDIFDYEDSASTYRINWGNSAAGLRWRYLVSSKLISDLGAGYTQYRFGEKGTDIEPGWFGDTLFTGYYNRSKISELNLNWDASWFPSTELAVGFGTQVRMIELSEYEEDYAEEYGYSEVDVWDLRDTSWIVGVYFEDKWQPSAFWVIETGLRGEYFNNGKYFKVSPRFGVKRRLNANWALKSGLGLYYQYLYELYSGSETKAKVPIIYGPDLVQADSAHPPPQTSLITLGSEYLFPRKGSISLEVYYKDLRNIWGASGLGQGYSYGGELVLEYGSSWLGYSFSVTRYRFGEDWFYPWHDSRHNINLSLTLPVKKTWQISAAWVLNSGFPYKGIIGYYQYTDFWGREDWYPVFNNSGDYRYPAYHRMDVGVSKKFKLFTKCRGVFYLQILNVYARPNMLMYQTHIDYDSGVISIEPIYMLPFPTPNIGFRLEF